MKVERGLLTIRNVKVEGRKRGEEIRKSNRGGEYDQSTLCAHMEM
jgi:hypothetical protein